MYGGSRGGGGDSIRTQPAWKWSIKGKELANGRLIDGIGGGKRHERERASKGGKAETLVDESILFLKVRRLKVL